MEEYGISVFYAVYVLQGGILMDSSVYFVLVGLLGFNLHYHANANQEQHGMAQYV